VHGRLPLQRIFFLIYIRGNLPSRNECYVSQKGLYRLQLSQALLTRVLSLSLLRRFVDVSPISELWFGEAVSTDSPLSAIIV